MARRHFFEIHDSARCPRSLRDGVTDVLAKMISIGKPYSQALAVISKGLVATETSKIIDLCSGGGGPWPSLIDALTAERPEVEVCLTDKHPNHKGFAQARERSRGKLTYRSQSTDATNLPPDIRGFRTLFSSFHHFRPEQARAILRDAVEKGEGIAIFEATERRISTTVFVSTVLLIATFFVVPFIRPWRLSRLAWTFLLPAIPFVVSFDGVISCMRTYTPEELLAFCAEVDVDNAYHWEAGKTKLLYGRGSYLLGYPRKADKKHGES